MMFTFEILFFPSALAWYKQRVSGGGDPAIAYKEEACDTYHEIYVWMIVNETSLLNSKVRVLVCHPGLVSCF
jgi:hypothetical protein